MHYKCWRSEANTLTEFKSLFSMNARLTTNCITVKNEISLLRLQLTCTYFCKWHQTKLMKRLPNRSHRVVHSEKNSLLPNSVLKTLPGKACIIFLLTTSFWSATNTEVKRRSLVAEEGSEGWECEDLSNTFNC